LRVVRSLRIKVLRLISDIFIISRKKKSEISAKRQTWMEDKMGEGKRSNEKFLTLRYTALHPRVRFVGKVLGELRTRVGDGPFRKKV